MEQRIIENLKQSPLFKLSLSSRELFHSNFLEWVCHQYQSAFGEILCERFSIPAGSISHADRERNNTDLQIHLDTGTIVIENKLKSIPSKEQLERYRQKSKKGNLFVLLTLTKPAFDPEEIGWQILSYGELSMLIDKLRKKVSGNESQSYHQQLLADYATVTQNLDQLQQYFIMEENASFDFNRGALFLAFKQLRMHDLYLKFMYWKLTLKLTDRLKAVFPGQVLEENRDHQYKTDIGKIVVFFNFVRGKGVLNIAYSSGNGSVMGIMVDEQKYLQYSHKVGADKAQAEAFALLLQNGNKWFIKNPAFVRHFPEKGGFNRYGNLLYRASFVPETTSINFLVEVMVSDLRYIVETF